MNSSGVSEVPVRYRWKKLAWRWIELIGSNSVMLMTCARWSSSGLDRDRPVEVGERDGVHRVDLVLAVEVGVEAVHHHDHLVGRRAARLADRR